MEICIMSSKSRNKRVGIGLMVVTISLVLGAVWAVLATSETALAAPPEGKGKGDDKVTTIYFDVLLGDVFLGADDNGDPVFGAGDIFMVCGSGIEGRIASGSGGTNIDRMVVNRPSPRIDITSVIGDVVTVDWQEPQDADCFGGIWDGMGMGYVGGKGVLLIELPDRTVNEMAVAFVFIAKDTKGKDVAYTIHTTGVLIVEEPGFGNEADWAAAQDTVNDGTANPEDIPNFFVQIAGGSSWTLSKSDGSQRFACTGDGTFESGFGIRITDPRLDMQNNALCP
jgi:hypothetical protein